jgi:hypothetical protein
MTCGEKNEKKILKKKKHKGPLERNRFGVSKKWKDVSELKARRFREAIERNTSVETRMPIMQIGPHPKVRSRERKRIHRESWEMTWKDALKLLRSSSSVYRE